MATILRVADTIHLNAYWCGPWGIAFRVEDDQFVVIDAIGRYRP
jgi:hypothetical protein